MPLFYFIKKYKTRVCILVGMLLSLIDTVHGQNYKFGVLSGFEFSSGYFDTFEEIPTTEKLQANYSFGLLVGKQSESIPINTKFGIYSLYRQFSVLFHENNIDPNYMNYLTQIKMKYLIIGLPAYFDLKVYSRKNFFINVQSGFSLELAFSIHENSYYHDGTIKHSRKLITNDYRRMGIPFSFGLGANFELGGKLQLGVYPTIKYYLLNFEPQSESDFAQLTGINLILLFK